MEQTDYKELEENLEILLETVQKIGITANEAAEILNKICEELREKWK